MDNWRLSNAARLSLNKGWTAGSWLGEGHLPRLQLTFSHILLKEFRVMSANQLTGQNTCSLVCKSMLWANIWKSDTNFEECTPHFTPTRRHWWEKFARHDELLSYSTARIASVGSDFHLIFERKYPSSCTPGELSDVCGGSPSEET